MHRTPHDLRLAKRHASKYKKRLDAVLKKMQTRKQDYRPSPAEWMRYAENVVKTTKKKPKKRKYYPHTPAVINSKIRKIDKQLKKLQTRKKMLKAIKAKHKKTR